MESKLVSFRIKQKKYDEILLECHKKNINVATWLEMKLGLYEPTKKPSSLKEKLQKFKSEYPSKNKNSKKSK
jgi:hypothetical protein